MIRFLFFLFVFHLNVSAQKYITNDASITFFSEAPMENIDATNSNVGVVYDHDSKELVFQLFINDFIFKKPLMQEHFNENYLESDKYPTSLFYGKIIDIKNDVTFVEGELTIHGVTNKIKTYGTLIIGTDHVLINNVKFIIRLKDYNIKIPKIVMYKIAEEIEVKVSAKLKKN